MNIPSLIWALDALVAIVFLFILAKKAQDPLKSFFQFIAGGLSEDNAPSSSTRINIFFAVTQWALVISYGFVYVVRNHPDLINGYLIVLASLIGALFGIKAYAKSTETKVDPPEVKP